MANNSSFTMALRSDKDEPHWRVGSSSLGHIKTDVLKSVLIISLLAVTLISSLVPFALRRAAINSAASVRRRHIFVAVFSLLSCFGGGVFLATCLLDLFPDTRELIGDGLDHLHIKTEFPLAEFLVAIGFFLVLFIEQIVLWFREHKPTRHNEEDRRQIVDDEEQEAAPSASNIQHRRNSYPSTRRNGSGVLGTIENMPVAQKRRHRHDTERNGNNSGNNQTDGSIQEEDDTNDIQGPSLSSLARCSAVSDASRSKHSHDDHGDDSDSVLSDIHFDPASHSTFRAIMLVVALSCHATFEGLALGLQLDAATALQIFGALCIHKCVIAFSLGMRLVQSRLSTLSIIGCCLLFCMSAVIGGFIGLAITESVKSSSAAMINGFLQGIACGTFLYITAFEILPHELNDGGYRLPKLLMLVLGFSFICLFVLVYPSD